MQIKRVLIGILIAVLAIAGFIAGYLVLGNQYTLKISLRQDDVVSIEYGQNYIEPGSSAEFFGTRLHTEPTDVPVVVEGAVNTEKLGVYLLKYKAQYGKYIGTAYRRVEVVDTKAPEITLVSNPDTFTLPGQAYKEEGYTAIDNHDGDITDQVLWQSDKDKVIYTVSDASGNVTTVERMIVYKDPEPPVLSLNGSKYIILQLGQQYEELGYVAADNCDGDITGKVNVSGSVNADKPGVYTLKYSVKDTYGNTASASRKITVVDNQGNGVQNPTQVIPKGKVIYLTFDDGPGKHTGRLLDVLKKYNVKATFFVTNKPKYNHYIGRAYREGHGIAIHTNSHKYSQIYTGVDAYFRDLEAVQNVIRGQTGTETTLLRFPGGSSNTVSKKYCQGIMTQLTLEVVARGYQYFDWNVDSKDAGGTKTANRVYQNVISGISGKRYAVVLQHDTKGFSVDAVERIVVWGLENGYTFMAMDATSPGCHHTIRN